MNRQYPYEALYQDNACRPQRWNHYYPHDSNNFDVGFGLQMPPYSPHPPFNGESYRQLQIFPRMRRVYQEKYNFDSSVRSRNQPRFLPIERNSPSLPEENMVNMALSQPHPYGPRKYYEDQYLPENYRLGYKQMNEQSYDTTPYGYQNFDDSVINNQQSIYSCDQPELFSRKGNRIARKYQRHTYIPPTPDYIPNQCGFDQNHHCSCTNHRFEDIDSNACTEYSRAQQFIDPYHPEFDSYYNGNPNFRDGYYGLEYVDSTSVKREQQEPIYDGYDEFNGYTYPCVNTGLPYEATNRQNNLDKNKRGVNKNPEQKHFQNLKTNHDSCYEDITYYGVDDSRTLFPAELDTFWSTNRESRNQKNANVLHQTGLNLPNCAKNKLNNKSMNGPDVNYSQTADASTQMPSWGENEVNVIDSKNESKPIDSGNMNKDKSKKLLKDNFLGRLQGLSLSPPSDYENRKSKTPFQVRNTVGKSKRIELLTDLAKDLATWNEREGSFGKKMPTRVIDPLLPPKPKKISSNTKVNDQNAQQKLITLDDEAPNKPIPNQTSSNKKKYKSKYINDLISESMKRKVRLEQRIQKQEEKLGITNNIGKITNIGSLDIENTKTNHEGKAKRNVDYLNESTVKFYEDVYGRGATIANYTQPNVYSAFDSIDTSATNQMKPRNMNNINQTTDTHVIPLPPPPVPHKNRYYPRMMKDMRFPESKDIQQRESNRQNSRMQSIPLPPPVQPVHQLNPQYLRFMENTRFPQSGSTHDDTQQGMHFGVGSRDGIKEFKPPMDQYPFVSKDVYFKTNNVIEELKKFLKEKGLWNQN